MSPSFYDILFLINYRPLRGRYWEPLEGVTLPCPLRGQG